MPYTQRHLEALELLPLYRQRSTIAAPAAPVDRGTPMPSSTTRSAHPQPMPAPKIPAPPTLSVPPATVPPLRTTPDTRAQAISAMDWDALQAAAGTCQACGLCKERKQAVVGVGARNAPWLFVGEGPGADEDEKGEPFVGQAGKLLDAMLSAAGLQRGREVYIANVVKCRPPGNRTPTADEAAACAPFLDRQIELINPTLIVAMGKTAALRLTGQDVPMGTLRGKPTQTGKWPLVVTYHPAYLLRSQGEKAKAWDDLVLAKQVMQRITSAT
jgi:uracil-DNA glycosylase